jgi:hypothetical protein
MSAPALLAELTRRGARVSIAPTPADGELPPLRLRVKAPEGALTPGLKAAIERHRPELLALVFELEERAALHLERDDASAAEWEGAERFARVYVRGAGANPDAALLDVAAHHPCVLRLLDTFKGAEIVEVCRGAREEEAA